MEESWREFPFIGYRRVSGAGRSYNRVMALSPDEPRARPLPDLSGDAVVRELLEQIAEEEELSERLSLDLSPPDPRTEYGPAVYPPLDVWLRRSEEIHRFLESLHAKRSARR